MSHEEVTLPVADEETRQRVIRTLDRPLVVEAGAGTGKTTLLVSRLLYAVETAAVRMADIVAISFTEKAAAELRWRLRQALEERCAASDAGTPQGQALRRALQEIQEAQISTIHAFAASILRERPVQAQLDPQFRTLDELESLQLQRAFWKRWVDEELEGEDAARLLMPALQAGVRLTPDLEVLGRSLYDNRDLQNLVTCPSIPAALEETMRHFCADFLKCAQHAEDNCHDAEDKGLLHLRQGRRQLQMLQDLQPASWPSIFLGGLRVSPTPGRKDSWRGDTCAENKAMRKVLQTSLQALQQHLSNRILRGSLQWLERWLAAYEAEKRRMGVLDFQDLLLQAQQLVRNDLAVRAELGRRIGMLCVDEFQDTDPLQAQLVLFLAEVGRPSPEWETVSVGAKLFLVGDPKQSIYRFRRADLEVYQRCCDIVRRSGGEVLDIVQNFRSRPAILQWTNAVFETLFAPAEDAATAASEPRQVPLVPLPESGNTRPAVWILRSAAQAPTAGAARDGARNQEARALVGMIERALREEWPVRTRQGSRAIEARDMALLFGRTSGIELYEDALRAAGIPFRQEGGKLFFQRQEVRDVLHALAACDDPHDEWSVVGALRSPLFGATDEELWRHRQRWRGFRYTEDISGSPLEEALAVLRDVHRVRHHIGIAGCVETLLDRTAARAVYAVQPQGGRALANLEMLARQARVFEASGDQGLREFVRSLRELEDETPRLAEWAPEEESGDHVRLITVHMAKGLEFPFVMLANLSTQGNSRSDPLLFDRMHKRAEARLGAADLQTSLKTAGFVELSEHERRKEAAEDRRLLYVAATRARDYLLVGDFPGDKATGYLKTLQGVPGALGQGACGELPEPHVAAQEPVHGPSWCVLAADQLPRAPRRPSRVTQSVSPEEWLAGRTVWAAQHQQRLQRGTRQGGRVSPLAILTKQAAAHVLEDARRDASRLGRAMHAILQEWTPHTPEDTTSGQAAEICDRVQANDLLLAVERMLRNVRQCDALNRWWDAGRVVGRSVPMQARLGDRLVEAVQDVLIETPEGIVCIDFAVRSHGALPDSAETSVQACRGALVLHAGRKLVCVGTLYLEDGVWRELARPVEQSQAFLDRLDS